jgi:hypothetical protein
MKKIVGAAALVLASAAALWVPAAAAARPAVRITRPAAYQVVQRDADGAADIVVTGRYTGQPSSIQARWDGRPWTVIDAAPAGGRYAGILPAQPQGQGVLEVRFADRHDVHVSHRAVGVGDVFIIAGQSNASGRAETMQKWSDPSLIACLFGNDLRWKVLKDPVDSVAGQRDQVSLEDLQVGGTIWPLLATRLLRATRVPIAFIPVPKGGSSVAVWQPDAAQHDDPTTLYGNMLRRYRAARSGVRAILYWGGEIDGGMMHRSGDEYLGYWDTIVKAVAQDFGCPIVEAQIGEVRWKQGTASLDAVRIAQRQTWSWPGTLAGPPLFDILLHRPDYPDEIHYITPDIMPKVAGRWWAAIRAGVYGEGDGRGPRLTAAVYDPAGPSVLLTFADAELPLYLPGDVSGAFTVHAGDAGGADTVVPVTRVDAVGDDQLRLQLAEAPDGAITVSLGEGHSGALNPVPKDSSRWRLPAELFVRVPVAF